MPVWLQGVGSLREIPHWQWGWRAAEPRFLQESEGTQQAGTGEGEDAVEQ